MANFVLAKRPAHAFHISHHGSPSFGLWILHIKLEVPYGLLRIITYLLNLPEMDPTYLSNVNLIL
jgi:hypothetical protein